MPDRPRLDQLNLVSANLPATVEFYRLLGVEIAEVPPDWAAWAAHHRNAVLEGASGIAMDLDSTAFAKWWAAEGLPPGPVVGFRVSQRATVDELYDRVTATGHPAIRAPYDAFWGARYAIVQDPDGVVVGIMSEVSEAHRGPSPDLGEFAPGA